MKDYVADYFDRNAQRWVEAAYVGGVRFPVGPERVRLAVEGVAPVMSAGSKLVDLGCGGGQLCVHAAELGWSAIGVDVAEAMIEEARANAGSVVVEWIVGAYDESGLLDGEADAVTALGLIEYFDDDGGLFAEAARLLRPGGRFAVSCRNRLYNLLSANDYTQLELEQGGEAPRLLGELRDVLAAASDDDLHALALSVAESAEGLRAAVDADRAEPPPELHDHVRAFQRGRRQHTPAELEAVAAERGLTLVETVALHPHPLPPALEALAPRTYNALALAWQRPLERSAVGLAFCTAFVSVFERTAPGAPDVPLGARRPARQYE
jgi:2-polyprenyl-6-hydroxyphenyl methylase/3-demethylubiquinone-9 3-methyltransferase